MTDKARIKDAILALEADRLAVSERAYNEYLRDAGRDPTEPRDLDQASQEFGNAELAQAFESPIQEHSKAIARLRSLDFGPKGEIEEGAVFKINGRTFVVAISTAQFVCDGVTYMGISAEAPVFKALEGKGVGDTAEFNGKMLKVEAVS